MGQLTALKVQKAKYPGGLTKKGQPRTSPVRLGDGAGLYLVIKPSGAKSWTLLVQHNGSRREIGLGGYPADLNLAEAREKAAALRKLARQGLDPRQERDRSKRTVPTFAEAVDRAHQQYKAQWADKTALQFKSSLTDHAIPFIGGSRVDQIDGADLVTLLRPIWNTKPQMARKVRHRVLQVLAFAKANGWRSAPVPDAIELRGGLGRQPRSKNFAAVPYAEVPAFYAAERTKAESPARLALLFTVLTAARSGEVRNADWKQIDREARTWTRPAEMMKSAVPHVLTLNDAALAILERAREMYGEEGLMFPALRGGVLSDMSLSKILRTAGRSETVHGFRSSFRDWAAEQMPQVPAMVAEMALAHSIGDATVEAYLRSDLRALRRTLLDAWGVFVAGRS